MNKIHDIPRRDLKFDLSKVDLKNWHPGGTYISHYFNAMSLLFPDGERFFINSVRYYQNDITDEKLKKDIKGFIGQEAMHGREHEAYNDRLLEMGYPIEKINKRLNKLLEFGKKWLPKSEQLRITIALEHFTAILANHLLTHPNQISSAPEVMKQLWQWHAIEETEHKAVAYDVYQEAVAKFKPKRSYIRRISCMVRTTFLFWFNVWWNFFMLVGQDKNLFNHKQMWVLLKFLYGSDGFVWGCRKDYIDYFRFNFHPWQHENFYFVENWIGQNKEYAVA